MSRVWVFADYSQAEARVVAWAGPVPRLRDWFREGKDVHTEVARLIARVTQESRLNLPGGLFTAKHWSTYDRKDPERQFAKNTVHANNYGMGKRKFALITGLPESIAAIVQRIYHELFPEIRGGYQAWIDDQLRRDRTIITPQGWPIRFYDIFGPELSRSAYSLYAQSTVGLLITKTLTQVGNHFSGVHHRVPSREPLTPQRIRTRGLDTRLQIHDALGVSCNEEDVDYVCSVLKTYGEQTLLIRGEPLVIPLDFKVGPSWADATDYKPNLLAIA